MRADSRDPLRHQRRARRFAAVLLLALAGTLMQGCYITRALWRPDRPDGRSFSDVGRVSAATVSEDGSACALEVEPPIGARFAGSRLALVDPSSIGFARTLTEPAFQVEEETIVVYLHAPPSRDGTVHWARRGTIESAAVDDAMAPSGIRIERRDGVRWGWWAWTDWRICPDAETPTPRRMAFDARQVRFEWHDGDRWDVGKTIGRVALTPVTATIDAACWVTTIATAPIWIPLLVALHIS